MSLVKESVHLICNTCLQWSRRRWCLTLLRRQNIRRKLFNSPEWYLKERCFTIQKFLIDVFVFKRWLDLKLFALWVGCRVRPWKQFVLEVNSVQNFLTLKTSYFSRIAMMTSYLPLNQYNSDLALINMFSMCFSSEQKTSKFWCAWRFVPSP